MSCAVDACLAALPADERDALTTLRARRKTRRPDRARPDALLGRIIATRQAGLAAGYRRKG